MVERISALSGRYHRGKYGKGGEPQVVLLEVPGISLHQLSSWPDTLDQVGLVAADSIGVGEFPGPGRAVVGSQGSLLRIEPLKWWCYGSKEAFSSLPADVGTALDLSHSRTHVRVTGSEAEACLGRLVPLDFRLDACPIGSVMSTSFHHVAITIWRSESGYELFIPRGFALSLWEILVKTATQFGVEIS